MYKKGKFDKYVKRRQSNILHSDFLQHIFACWVNIKHKEFKICAKIFDILNVYVSFVSECLNDEKLIQ